MMIIAVASCTFTMAAGLLLIGKAGESMHDQQFASALRPPRVRRLQYARVSAPDLDEAERFGTDFGLRVCASTQAALYLRGTDPLSFIYVVERGAPGIVAIGFALNDADDLEVAARIPGASPVEDVDEPGGGRRVVVRDPLGFRLELVHGQRGTEPIPVSAVPLNSAAEPYRRVGAPSRPPRGPAQVRALGHVVLVTPDVAAVTSWYQAHLGLLLSDVVLDRGTRDLTATFLRTDHGEDYVDHHAVNIALGPVEGVNHFAFEVRDVDDVMTGLEHLQSKAYQHMRGPGRHVIGSQVFDYWLDPWGLMLEHYTDTDMLNASSPAGEYLTGDTPSPWGPANSPQTRGLVFR
jgi:catechol 2,3-dioxygenase-like lactoylglutathione lyase family enzyme